MNEKRVVTDWMMMDGKPVPVPHWMDEATLWKYLALPPARGARSVHNTMHRLRGQGLPFVRISKFVRYRKDLVDEWVAKNKAGKPGKLWPKEG